MIQFLTPTILAACSGGTAAERVDISAQPIGTSQCAVCSMTVSEQPAPRAQLVRRDGTRAHFCALSELRADLQAPSPHGEAVAIYVEALPAAFDPSTTSTAPLPWVAADEAWYVFGVERPLVMGLPGLSYRSEADARHAAGRLGLEVVPWSTVLATPFNLKPDPHAVGGGGEHR